MPRRAAKWLAMRAAGAFAGAGVLLLTSTLIGAGSSLDPPWNYTLAFGIAALLAAAFSWYFRGYGWDLPPPWAMREPQRHGAHGVATTPGEEFSIVRFDLYGQMNQRVPVARRAKAVEFLEPTHKIVKEPLPVAVRWRFRTIAVVKSFADDSIILDARVHGVSISVQVYHAERASA